jgi:N-glycosylase/DNA lyase
LGGQSFSWNLIDEKENVYLGFTQDRIIKTRFAGDYMYWQTYPKKDDYKFIEEYFQLGIDYHHILEVIGKCHFVNKAIKKVPNIRILKQPLDFTILSFIISANKNIRSIRQSVRYLAAMYGESLDVDDRSVYLFPSTKKVASLTRQELRGTSVGFRAKYLKSSADQMLKQDWRDKLCDSDEMGTRKALTELYGVGEKIADCVMTFALGFENVTPIDVWAKRLLIDLYDLPDDWKYRQYRGWVQDQFGGYAAYAMQYLFEWYRVRVY